MRKTFAAILLAAVITVSSFAGGHHKSSSEPSGKHKDHVAVKAYTKKDGTKVKAHHRSKKDDKFDNNWSTKGNKNPDTGKKGTKTHPNHH